jgi:hypothetical protein
MHAKDAELSVEVAASDIHALAQPFAMFFPKAD